MSNQALEDFLHTHASGCLEQQDILWIAFGYKKISKFCFIGKRKDPLTAKILLSSLRYVLG